MNIIRTLVAVLLLSLLATLHAAETANSARPNIVFVFSDDHSLQTIGAYHARLPEFCRQQGVTPNMDRLAAQGGFFADDDAAYAKTVTELKAELTRLRTEFKDDSDAVTAPKRAAAAARRNNQKP